MTTVQLCRACWQPFHRDTPGPRTYCSAKCRRDAELTRQRLLAPPPSDSHLLTCQKCLAKFQHRSKATLYCSRKCKQSARTDRRRERDHRKEPNAVCPVCKAEFYRRPDELRRQEISYCSKSCGQRARLVQRGYRLLARDLVPSTRTHYGTTVLGSSCAINKRSSQQFIAGFCPSCGTPFVSTRPVRFCSDLCAKREHKRNRKHRERAAAKTERVFRRKVFDRDEWTCQLCFKPIDPDLEAPDPGAATIDHRIPLCAPYFGDHTYENVQAAHYGCNSGKGARVSQLALC